MEKCSQNPIFQNNQKIFSTKIHDHLIYHLSYDKINANILSFKINNIFHDFTNFQGLTVHFLKRNDYKEYLELILIEKLLFHYFPNLCTRNVKVIFSKKHTGKPYLEVIPELGGHNTVPISISHSGSVIGACMGSIGTEIGLDIQKTFLYRQYFFDRLFNIEERSVVSYLVEKNLLSKDKALSMLWSVKEAIVKCLDLSIFVNAKDIIIQGITTSKKNTIELNVIFKDCELFVETKEVNNYFFSVTSYSLGK